MVDNYKHKGKRNNLVKELQAKGISNHYVLSAITKIPRHFFFDLGFDNHAYEDKAFPIGEGQTISQPYTVALQTEILNIQKGDNVLEIGTGCGYQSSILLSMGVKLTTIERVEKLYNKANETLRILKFDNFTSILGDGSIGYLKNAPYDKIIVTAGAPYLPDELIHQLKVGGQMIIPIGDKDKQIMTFITREREKAISKEELGTFSFVPLIGTNAW